jgi:neutral ceramidase
MSFTLLHVMDQLQDVKAGPSGGQPQWIQKSHTPNHSRRLVIVAAAATLLVYILRYTALIAILSDDFRSVWLFYSGKHSSGADLGSSKGSRYLLGVGKADITG